MIKKAAKSIYLLSVVLIGIFSSNATLADGVVINGSINSPDSTTVLIRNNQISLTAEQKSIAKAMTSIDQLEMSAVSIKTNQAGSSSLHVSGPSVSGVTGVNNTATASNSVNSSFVHYGPREGDSQ